MKVVSHLSGENLVSFWKSDTCIFVHISLASYKEQKIWPTDEKSAEIQHFHEIKSDFDLLGYKSKSSENPSLRINERSLVYWSNWET